jgi:hypothetical protein
MVIHVMGECCLVGDNERQSVEGVFQSIATVLLSRFAVGLSPGQTVGHYLLLVSTLTNAIA